jgi:hypothetical protein
MSLEAKLAMARARSEAYARGQARGRADAVRDVVAYLRFHDWPKISAANAVEDRFGVSLPESEERDAGGA